MSNEVDLGENYVINCASNIDKKYSQKFDFGFIKIFSYKL